MHGVTVRLADPDHSSLSSHGILTDSLGLQDRQLGTSISVTQLRASPSCQTARQILSNSVTALPINRNLMRHFSTASAAAPASVSDATSATSESDSKQKADSQSQQQNQDSAKPRKSRSKVGFILLFAALAGAGAYYSFDENVQIGLRRSISFWGRAFPIYLHYRITQFRVTTHIVAHSLLCPTIEDLLQAGTETYRPVNVADYSMGVLNSVLSRPLTRLVLFLRPLTMALPEAVRKPMVEFLRLPGTEHIGIDGHLGPDAPTELRALMASDSVSLRPPDAPEIEGAPGRYLAYLDTVKGLTYGPLNERYADAVLDAILSLRGYYIKLGQMGSLTQDFFPPSWIRRLETLQSHVPAEPYEYVRDVIEKELGCPIDEVFSYFEPVPLGAASIGQTHLARLKKTGELVVVKIQYNNVEQMFAQDMSTIKLFCRLAQPEHLAFLEEIEKQFHTEFDYRIEAHNLERIGTNMNNSPYAGKVVVPQPLHDMCTKRVLVMEYLPAIKIYDVLLGIYARVRGKSSIKELTQEDMREMKKYMDQVTTNRIWAASLYYSVRDKLSNALRWFYNVFIGPFTGAKLAYLKPHYTVDMAKTLELLFQVHGHQVIKNGFFNADPHPGNVLLFEDGRLGLIDFGSCKELTKRDRRLLARLYNALEKQDWYQIVRVYNHMGYQHNEGCEDIIYQMAVLGFDYDTYESRGGMNVQSYFETLYERNPLPHDIDEWVMPSRVSILLRGLGHALNYPVRTSTYFGPIGREYLKKEGRLNPEEAQPYMEAIEVARVRLFEKVNKLERELVALEASSESAQLLSKIVAEAREALATVPPATELYHSPKAEWVGNLELEDALDVLERAEKFLDKRKPRPIPPRRNSRGSVIEE